MTYDERLFLVLLGNLFIEIRARESASWEVARKIADLFHNLPYQLQSGWAAQHPEEIWDMLYIRADELKLGREWVLSMRASAEASMSWRAYRSNGKKR